MDERLYKRLDSIDEAVKAMDRTLAVNTEQLRLHMEGVKLAREQNEILRQEMNGRLDIAEKDLSMTVAHVNRVDGGFKLAGFIMKALGAAAAIIGTVASVLKVLEYFKR